MDDSNETRRGFPRGLPLRRLIGATAATLALAFAGTTVHAAAAGTHVTPRLTSVEGGSAQVFTARFFNATGGPAAAELVNFTNDACGTFSNGLIGVGVVTDAQGLASATFTADSLGGVVCDVTATSTTDRAAAVRFEVVTYTLAQVELVPATPAIRPAPGAPYRLEVALRMGLYTLYNVDISALILPGAVTAFFVPPTTGASASSGQSGRVAFTVQPDSAVGTYDIRFSHGNLTKTLTIYFNAGLGFQGLWWVGESENGWGVSIVQHGDKFFCVIFAYDLVGNPVWYAMPAGAWTTGGAGYRGLLYRSRGSPFHAYNAAAFDPLPVGSATLDLTTPDSIAFEYTIDGVSDDKLLSRFPFAVDDPTPIAPVVDDMWWGGAAQDGQGVAILQRGTALFLLWFTYRDDGSPVWFSMPVGTWTSSTTYQGRIYRTRGSPWLGRVYLAEMLEVSDVGAFTLRLLPDGTAALDYAIDGRSGTFALTRFPF